jgi:3-dehydrotetronate 4-kinase
MTNRQVATYVAAGHPSFKLDPLELSVHGINLALQWLALLSPASTPIIYTTSAPEDVRSAQTTLGLEPRSSVGRRRPC